MAENGRFDFFDLQSAVLPQGLSVHYGPATKPPEEDLFVHGGYEPPAHSVKPLLEANPGDGKLVFHEGPHVYLYEGVPASASVTDVAHSCEPAFKASDAIDSMRASKKQAWPRLEYVKGATKGGAWNGALGILLRSQDLTVAALPENSFSSDTSLEQALEVLEISRIGPKDDDEEVYFFERVLTDAEIGAEWARNGAEQSARGTEAHHQAELFFNGLSCRWWSEEMQNVTWFVRTHMEGMESRHTEFEIYFPEADLAGSIDLILWDRKRRVFHLVDHKRSEKLPREMRGYGKMLPPLAHLDKCKAASFALQLSIYQYILERCYGMTIGDRVLLSLHPSARFATAVPYLGEEVALLMERRIALVRARRACADRDATFRCALTGAPVHDAVELEDGSIAAMKAAQVRGLSFEPHEPTRKRFREAVEAVVEDVAPPAKWAKGGWRRQMPDRGLPPFC